ncbi:MAG: hypothetical protein JO032_08855 [Alphaproteobacteria bacterium]|nr:hypothetical protein [Alphaproteobacteria bacterium]
MKTLLATVSAFAIAAVVSLSPASAAQYSPQATASGTPHWEWQYHYAGHHPRYQGHWVWVQ